MSTDPQMGANTCPGCAGSGEVDGAPCGDCAGSGTVEEIVGDA